MSAAATMRVPTLSAIAPPPEPDALPLPHVDDATVRPEERWFLLGGEATARNVGRPTLTPYLPAQGGTGAAVVIAAGGGGLIESLENEAWPQARWLAERGIAAFVLKYRLVPTPADPELFAQALAERFARAADAAQRSSVGVPSYMVDDAVAAMRYVRAQADDWQIDPERVGFLGFSAGAMIGLDLVDRQADHASPAFLGAIYPSMAARPLPAAAPPLFAAMAADDPLYGRQGYGLVEAWLAAGQSAELHVYSAGGHGFGMGLPGTTSAGVMDAFYRWLDGGGWLTARATGGDE